MTAPAIPQVAPGTKSDLDMVMLSSRVCGFCATGTHSRCPGGTRSGRKGVRICPCEVEERCGQKRCLKCKNPNQDEVGDSWLCLSGTECEGRVQSRLAADPQHQAMIKAREKANMATATETKAKREKVVKEGKCLVTGKPTKGGLFAPGMDAKYVSLKVAEVQEANFTKKAQDAALKAMRADGVSDKLVAKFEKAVGLAKIRVEKAKEAAAAKAAEKADKAKAGKATKADDTDDEA